MFEIGKNYQITMIELTPDGPSEGWHVSEILDVKEHLIKVSHPKYGYEILNTNSHHFVKAVPVA